MVKRIFDLTSSFFGILVLSPILIVFILLVFIQDGQNPFYRGERVGLKNKKFMMLKLRSMSVNADNSGVDSTANDDIRITKVGKLIRKFKIDELFQLWNVLLGEMSVVGPRPNVQRDVDLYTLEEFKILDVKPGITDLASIVFSDEGDILEGSADPDLTYNQIIRPWKSRLAIFYTKNSNMIIDIKIILLTIISMFNKKMALMYIKKILHLKDIDPNLLKVVSRSGKLKPYFPPGSKEIVIKR